MSRGRADIFIVIFYNTIFLYVTFLLHDPAGFKVIKQSVDS